MKFLVFLSVLILSIDSSAWAEQPKGIVQGGVLFCRVGMPKASANAIVLLAPCFFAGSKPTRAVELKFINDETGQSHTLRVGALGKFRAKFTPGSYQVHPILNALPTTCAPQHEELGNVKRVTIYKNNITEVTLDINKYPYCDIPL